MTPLAAPRSSTSRWRKCRSPWRTTFVSDGGSACAASNRRWTASLARHSPASSTGLSCSSVFGTRTAMSARPIGSCGRPSSNGASCSARRNRPKGAASAARVASSSPSGSRPGTCAAPNHGHGNSPVGRPTNTGSGIGSGSRGASCGNAPSSRSKPGMATARRGKRNTQRSSTSQAVLSQPTPSSCSDSSATSGNWSVIRPRASGSSTVTSALQTGIPTNVASPRDNPGVPASGSVRRRQAGVLVVGAAEPEIQPWLRAAGHIVRAVRRVGDAALPALDEEPADLVIVDREPGGLDARRRVPRAARATRGSRTRGCSRSPSPRTGRTADAALDAGADDYLHRPFTRAELLARARAGLRAAQQRADDALVRALMVNVPGAIYRSAWHAGHTLELISDEIERISGYPPANFIASTQRTLVEHRPPRRPRAACARRRPRRPRRRAVRARVPDRPRRRRDPLGARPRPPRPGRRRAACGWTARSSTSPSAAPPRRRCASARSSTPAPRSCARRARRIVAGGRRRPAQDRARPARRRPAAPRRDGARGADRALARREATRTPRRPFLERLGEELSEASAELRELARGIHPAVLTERGLAPAISALADRAPVPVEIVALPESGSPPAAEATAYFTVAEALTNVAKYADASHATVRLAQRERRAGDRGPRRRHGRRARRRPAPGSAGLADRVGALDGSLSIDSPPGEGTLLRAVLPL